MAGGKGKPVRAWSRQQREQIIAGLLRHALIEMRFIASQPDQSQHPDGHLAHIRAIADVCHNLPGAGDPRLAGEYDAIIWTWQTADAFQRLWLQNRLAHLGADLSFLENAPRLPKPATPPDTRPRWGHWQLPRRPNAFTSVDSVTLSALVRSAWRVECLSSKTAVREAFIEWILDHLAPEGGHILRPSTADETIFVQDGPVDLRQYRALLAMCDGTLIVHHPRLRESDLIAVPRSLSLYRRYLLSAVPKRSHERDAGLWANAHRARNPECRDWTIPGQQPGRCPCRST